MAGQQSFPDGRCDAGLRNRAHQAEVGQFDLTALGEQDVLGFEVAVHQPAAVRDQLPPTKSGRLHFHRSLPVPTGHSVLTPLWSLPYEVEMYLVLPVAYLIARRRDGLTWMLTLVVASTLAGYAFGKLKHGHMNLAAYVPCFLAGVACYLVRDRLRPRISGRWWPLFVIGAVSAYCVVHTVSDRLIYWIGWLYCITIAAAIPLAFVAEWLTMVIYFGVAALWLLPDKRLEAISGE